MLYPKIYIGPMSVNVVDSVIQYSVENNIPIGLLPSRRQIEYDGGYVNNWKTIDFIEYVKSKNNNVTLQRDHAGPAQGADFDDGTKSLMVDAASGFQLLHIDPWKHHQNLEDGIRETSKLITMCNVVNPNCFYEIGTEQAIREYSVEELEQIILQTKESIGNILFNKVKYAVIQGGTRIEGTRNVGVFDEQRCKKMIEVCRRHGLLSKEHNGDYLSPNEIKMRFDMGLSALNIAPEFGVIETQCILEEILSHFDTESLEQLYQMCYQSAKWIKWLPSNIENSTIELKKHVIIRTCGHYVFAYDDFKLLKSKFLNIDDKIQRRIKQRLQEIICATK